MKEESLRGKPGYEHLNEPLHILVEAEAAEIPASIVDARLKQARDIIEELLKPVVCSNCFSDINVKESSEHKLFFFSPVSLSMFGFHDTPLSRIESRTINF